MAVNESRSLNGELAEGLTDGLVRKLNPDRSGTSDDERSRLAARERARFVPWVRIWSEDAAVKAEKEAVARYTTLFG